MPRTAAAPGGGGNGWASAAVEVGVAGLGRSDRADADGLPFPPGTSKWNKVEHRLFSSISSNWRGEPLRDYETVVQLIAATTIAKGLQVTCRLDHRRYPLDAKSQTKSLRTSTRTPTNSTVNGIPRFIPTRKY